MSELREALQPYVAAIVGVPLMLFIFIDSWRRERRFRKLFGKPIPKECWKHDWAYGHGPHPDYGSLYNNIEHRICRKCGANHYKTHKWFDYTKAVADRKFVADSLAKNKEGGR